MERAACAGQAPDKRAEPEAVDPWFPEKGQPLKYGQIHCFTCPVRAECDDYRDRTDSRHGMWGGEMVKRNKKKGA